MSPNEAGDLRRALRNRIESEALLGATHLPISARRPPAATGTGGSASGAHGVSDTAPRRTPAVETTPVAGILRRATTDDAAVLAERKRVLDELDQSQVRGCRKCGLCEKRTQTVFGQGSPVSRIVFVGEGPGFEEDRTGLAFVGRAGELLTKMIEAGMGLRRDDVYICNVVKCRPPDNRTPAPDEIAACSPYLLEQLRVIEPEVIIALGGPAAQTLLNTREGITRLRGRFHDFHTSGSALVGSPTPLMPTFHPAYLLRNPADKPKVWADLQQVMAMLGLPLPKRA